MPRRVSKPKPMRLQQLVNSKPAYPVHLRVVQGLVGPTDDESIAAGDILVIMLDKEDTYMSCRDVDDNRFTVSMDCPFLFLETGLSAAQSAEEWQHYLDTSLIARPGRSLSQLARYPLPMVVALKDEVTQKKGISPRDCAIFDKVVQERVVVCHRNTTGAANGNHPTAITLPISSKLKVTLASSAEAMHDYETLWSSPGQESDYSLVHRLAVGVHPAAQQTFNAKVSHRGRYKSPASATGPRRSTVAVAGNLAPSPYRRSSQPSQSVNFTPNMFGRPSTALTGLPSHATSRPRLSSNAPISSAARQRAATTSAVSKPRKSYQTVHVSPNSSRSTSQPSSQQPSHTTSRDTSRPSSRDGNCQGLAPITLDQVRALQRGATTSTTTSASTTPPSVSQPVAVPAHVRQGYEFEDPPTPPHRPSLGLRPSSAVLTNTEVPPPPEDDEGEFGFSDYNNLDPEDNSTRLNGLGDTTGAYSQHRIPPSDSHYGVVEASAESHYGTAFDILSDDVLFGSGLS